MGTLGTLATVIRDHSLSLSLNLNRFPRVRTQHVESDERVSVRWRGRDLVFEEDACSIHGV